MAATPQCVSTVQVVNGHDEEWRKKRYGENWRQCTRPSTVILDGEHLCRRHAGERVLEQYLDGEVGPIYLPPEDHVLTVMSRGEAQLLHCYTLESLEAGSVQGIILREAKTVAELKDWIKREPL